jgi:hypothetical protein
MVGVVGSSPIAPTNICNVGCAYHLRLTAFHITHALRHVAKCFFIALRTGATAAGLKKRLPQTFSMDELKMVWADIHELAKKGDLERGHAAAAPAFAAGRAP